jgi:HemY protein
LVGLGAVAVSIAAAMLIWSGIRFVLRLPPTVSGANRARRRDKGYAALSRGIIAVGSGDARLAIKAAAEAQRHLPGEPLALLLRAEAAQLAGDHHAVESAFTEMTRRSETRLLGFRGLHAHAHRRGNTDAAHDFAHKAHGITAMPWTAAAILEKHVAAQDWEGALAALDNNRNLIDRTTRDRQRAVLMTASALGKEQAEPDEALRLARAAVKGAPDLVPAVALAARLLSRQGYARKAAKMIEATWALSPHPDLAKVYLDLRPGESHAERLARARTLVKLAPQDPESRLAVARAAIGAGDYKAARDSMLPLIQGSERPTARMCLIMAELEEAEHGDSGFTRDWLARAIKAPRDATWIAGNVTSDRWLPALPATGKLDVFIWKRPEDRLHADETEEAIFRPISGPVTEPPVLIEKPRAAIASPEPETAAALTPNAAPDTKEPESNASVPETTFGAAAVSPDTSP